MMQALQDLFLRHRAKASGVWQLGGDKGRTLFLEAGDVVFAQSGLPSDRLTAILVERGKLTQAQMDYALANLKPGLSIGKNLIDMGFITQRDLLDTARAQVERILKGVLATPDEEPEFEERDLETTVVRLPLDTPAMLLAGLLALEDRETVLDLLGPVNQVVVLEGRKVQELQLPQDLSKILPLLDGTRTLLEISRETGSEPFRIGAFCLFLREIGWARLHELPPLDRGALEQALLPPPEPLSPPLDDPAPTPALMAAIEDAARPTTNLDHMAEALDELPDPEPFPEPDPLPEPAPTPATPLRFPVEEEDPSLQISEASSISLVPPPPVVPPQKSSRSLIFITLTLAALATAYLLWPKRRPVSPPSPDQARIQTPPAQPPPAPEPTPETPATKVPEPKPPAPTGKAGRLKSIREGDWEKSLAEGAAHRQELGEARWTLRLEVACLGATVQNAEALLEQKDPDLWLLPMRMRDAKTCYQVLLGDYPTAAAAEKAARSLPKSFHALGNRPKAFRLKEIPDRQ